VALKSKSPAPVAKPQAKTPAAAKPAVKPAEAAPKVMLPNAIASAIACRPSGRAGLAHQRRLPGVGGQRSPPARFAPAAKAAPGAGDRRS
jgi:hypothetical protein